MYLQFQWRYRKINDSYFLNAMEIAVLSPSMYSSLEKKSKLESIGFRPSCVGFLVEEELPTTCQEGVPLLVFSWFLGEVRDC